ncbi:MAG: hypothetical protein E6G45_03725 [Actinobacteria bacterium]|nr:MAG: hypothetical protein E6G45_03725 [Actinomycetota bacterium]
MRRSKHLLMFSAVAAFILVGAAAATRSHPQTTDVSATFNATQTRSHSRTCTEGSNTFRVTNARWRGTTTSTEPRLDGTLVLDTHAVLNVTTGDGWLTGTWRSRNVASAAHGNNVARSSARISAVIDNGNHLDGIANGDAHAPNARLLGNWSATVAADAITGELGSNAPVAPDNSALLYRGGCP